MLMDESTGFRWWHAALILVAANAISALPVGFVGDFAFFNSLRQPALTPPDWAFAPVWLVLNITSLIALYRIANTPGRSLARTSFLRAEGVSWVLFSAFTTLYFLLRSPVLGAADTVAGLITGLASFGCALRIDRPSAGLILLRMIWLALASYVALNVAISNPDLFLGNALLG